MGKHNHYAARPRKTDDQL